MDYKTFLKLAGNYHKNNRRDTELYFEILKRRNAWNQGTWDLDFVNFIFSQYLFKWGRMQRVYPKEIQKKMYSKFLKAGPMILEESSDLSSLRLLSPRFETQKDSLAKVYEKICGLNVPYRNRKVRIGPTGTSKILHLLFPNLFVIWDRKWVREKQGYGETSSEYVRYLSNKREILQGVVQSFMKQNGGNAATAIKTIEELHADDLSKKGFEMFKEPVTKLLDEINYTIQTKAQ